MAVALIVVLALLRLGYDRGGSPAPSPRLPLEEGDYDVLRIVDGDTLLVRERDETASKRRREEGLRLRLLGIDCPESVKPDHPVEPWGPEATAFTHRFVSSRVVRLQFDKRQIDQYGRCLAYVYVDDRMLNEELVRAGLARVSTYPGDSATMARRFRAAEREAREQARGMWSAK
jgi:micrococcal nuclease